MSRRNHFFAAWMLVTLLFAARAFAGESLGSSTPPTNRLAFNATLHAGETVGDHQIQRAFLTVGTNQIAFIVPTDFCMDASNPGKIVLSDNTGGYFITVRISNMSAVDSDSQAGYFKAMALNRFPGAKISSESSEFAANHSGPAFNLEWVGDSGTAQSARIAFIPTAAGVLEFSVLSRHADFKDAQIYLTVLMASVHSNETGKLVIRPLPNNS